jgi:hypothetical protein
MAGGDLSETAEREEEGGPEESRQFGCHQKTDCAFRHGSFSSWIKKGLATPDASPNPFVSAKTRRDDERNTQNGGGAVS